MVKSIRATAALAALMIAVPAMAQQAAPKPGSAPPAPLGWYKQCFEDPQTKEHACQTARDKRDDTSGVVQASVSVREGKTAADRTLNIAVPPGLQIRPGVRILVDETNLANAGYKICYASACIVESKLPDNMLAQMRKGKLIRVQAITVQNAVVNLDVALDGFGKAYDGEATPTEEIMKKQRAWADAMLAWQKANAPKQPQQDGAAAQPAQ